MIRRSFFFLMAAILTLGGAASAQDRTTKAVPATSAESRVALIIGNGNYKDFPLANPTNDARDIAVALTGLGFQVILRENVNQRGMKQAVREFGDRIKAGSVGLFYFAGHGIQVKGRNYLVPVGSQIQREDEVEDESVDVNLVLEKMEAAGNRLNIVVLDACRNNPFQRSFRSASRGLAPLDAAKGTLIAFATAPGSVAADGVGRNGVFTRHLLTSLKHPESDIEKVFRRVRAAVLDETKGQQVPWETSSLTGDFYFNPGQTGAAAPATALAAIDTPLSVEIAYWQSIQASKNRSDFENYLKRYPAGQFLEIATSRLAEVGKESAAVRPSSAATASVGSAKVYFLRRGRFINFGLNYEILHRGKSIGELSNGAYFAATLPAGDQTIVANAAGVGDISRAYELEAGKTYFIEVVTAFGTAGTMRMISNQEGEPAIKDLPDSSIAASRQ
jgi:hypothetical protein